MALLTHLGNLLVSVHVGWGATVILAEGTNTGLGTREEARERGSEGLVEGPVGGGCSLIPQMDMEAVLRTFT